MTGLQAELRTPDGWAVAHGVLTVTDLRGDQIAHVPADARGAVATEPLPPGVYTAVLTAAGYRPVARTAQIGSDGSGSLGQVALAPTAGAVEPPEPGRWLIDPAHSAVVATARHLGIASIRARFTEVAGQIIVGSPLERSSVHAEIKTASVHTGLATRDESLRSAEYLDVAAHPLIVFRSVGLRRRGENAWTMLGELSLHGQRRTVELNLAHGGTRTDASGEVRASFHAETKLHQADFAADLASGVRTGLAAIGTTVTVELDMQAVRADTRAEA